MCIKETATYCLSVPLFIPIFSSPVRSAGRTKIYCNHLDVGLDLKFLVKVFTGLYLPNFKIDLIDTLPIVIYCSEVLCSTIMACLRDLQVKVMDFEIKFSYFSLNFLQVYISSTSKWSLLTLCLFLDIGLKFYAVPIMTCLLHNFQVKVMDFQIEVFFRILYLLSLKIDLVDSLLVCSFMLYHHNLPPQPSGQGHGLWNLAFLFQEKVLLLNPLNFNIDLVDTLTVVRYCITQTCPCNILQYFTAVKMVIFKWKNIVIFLFLPKT